MLLPRHEVINVRPPATSRLATIGGVGLLHVLAVYALIAGLTGQLVPTLPPNIVLIKTTPETPVKPIDVPPKPIMAQPTQMVTPRVPVPIVETEAAPDAHTIIVARQDPYVPPVADSGPTSVGNSHSTPPYPPEARNASHQGMVLLNIVVSPQGDVVSATVAQSSGFAELDQTAVSWVIAHWHYKPAIRGGVPVTSQTQAAVKFDLKQAHR